MLRLILLLFLVPAHGFQPWTLPPVRPTHVALLSSVSSFANSTAVPSSSLIVQPILLQRSSTAAISCVLTWATIQYTGWSIVRASSAVGVISALLLSPSFAAAALCGSFAGMSAQIATASQTALLGLACGLVLYVWDANQVQIGKGGRLGTIAFLGNMMFYSIRHGGPGSVLRAIVHTLTPATAWTVAASSLVSIVSGRPKVKGTRLSPLLRQASKAVLFASLFHRLITNGVSLSKWGVSAACMFGASLVVQNATPWNGVVLATAAVGLLGSFTPWAAALYLGAFIGMTGRADYKMTNFVEAALLSAILFELGLLNGFGGRLGFLAFLGVSFGI